MRYGWSGGRVQRILPLRMPLKGERSPVRRSNSVSDLGGAKRARTADLLHAMGNATFNTGKC